MHTVPLQLQTDKLGYILVIDWIGGAYGLGRRGDGTYDTECRSRISTIL